MKDILISVLIGLLFILLCIVLPTIVFIVLSGLFGVDFMLSFFFGLGGLFLFIGLCYLIGEIFRG